MSANSIAEKVEVIADAAYEKGKTDNDKELWDIRQRSGSLKNYGYFFAGAAWTEETVKPIYDIKPTNIYSMFNTTNTNGTPFSLIKAFENIEFDTSNATTASTCFSNAFISDCPYLDLAKASNLTQMFLNSKIAKIVGIRLKDDGSQTLSKAFDGCDSLVEVSFDGVIGQDISFQLSPLNKASLENIRDHLSPTTTGKTVTFKKTAVNAAFGVNVDDVSTYTEEFNEWRNGRSNWTFSYA